MSDLFEETLDLGDFSLVEGSTTDNSYPLNDREYTTVYELDLSKGEGIALGRGRKANQTDARGRVYAEFDQDGGSDISAGKVRFVVLNSQNNVRRVIAQKTTGQISRGSSDRSSREPFPVQERDSDGRPIAVSYPWKLGIQIKLNSASGENVDDAESGTTAEIDALRYEDTGGR